jgi:hypothetical protein
MGETPWYLVDGDAMREYAEAVALYEAMTGLTFDHARPFPCWDWRLIPDNHYPVLTIMQNMKIRRDTGGLYGIREWALLSRALTDLAQDIGCTFEELKAACLRECEHLRSELPPEEESEPLDVEEVAVEEEVPDNVEPIFSIDRPF